MFSKAIFMPPLGLGWVLFALLVIQPVPVMAERADRDKPMHIEADRLRFDEAKQVRVITGNVLITKGSIIIRGSRVELRQDTAGNQFAKVISEAGKRAFFRQKRDGLDEHIEGDSDTIEYDGKLDTVKFIGQAEMRRLRGAALFDQMNGSLITYDNQTEVFSVDGASNTPNAAPGGSGRIRLMLTPTPAASVPAASGAPGRGPALRSSTALESK